MGGGLCHRRDWIGLSTGMALTDGRRKKQQLIKKMQKKCGKSRKTEKIPFFLIIMCLVNFAGDMFGPVLDFL